VLKHARATRITVRVGSLEDRLTVDVHDDGIGGIGSGDALTALHDRVLSVGGRLGVHSPPGGGTTIRAVL
jgi:signal transduction histidine kinase